MNPPSKKYIHTYGEHIIFLYRDWQRLDISKKLYEVLLEIKAANLDVGSYKFSFSHESDEEKNSFIFKIFEEKLNYKIRGCDLTTSIFEVFKKSIKYLLDEKLPKEDYSELFDSLMDEDKSVDEIIEAPSKARENKGENKSVDKGEKMKKFLTRSVELEKIEKHIESVVQDQELALNELIKQLQLRDWKLKSDEGPSVFLLLGAPISGKSLFARTLIDANPGRPHLEIDLATFQSSNQGFGLVCQEYGFEDAGPGRLTSFVHKNPNGIVFLRNIEQAHPNTQTLLIPLIADNGMYDAYGFAEKGKAEYGNL